MQRLRVLRGEAHPNSKLDRAQIDAYRERHAQGESYRALAREAGVAPNTVIEAVKGHTYRK